MRTPSVRTPEYFKAQAAADTARIVSIGYAAGSLLTALEHHIAWLDTLGNRLSERGVTAERRRLIIEKEVGRLREILAAAEGWIGRP